MCHATASYSNPYTVIEVDVASVQFEGHDGHNGPIFFPEIPNDQQWGDIIPAFDYGDGMQYAGKNWPAGQAMVDGGCTVPDAEHHDDGADPRRPNPGTTTTTTAVPTTTTTTSPPSTTTTTVPPATTTPGIGGSPTTTVPPTSTTAPNAPTSPTEAPVTTSPTSTVGTEGEHATTPSSTATSPGTKGLPFTGSGALPLGLGGLVLVATGAALALGRRRQLAR